MFPAYNSRLKKIFRRRGENSVAWYRLNEGTLIVDIKTAEVFTTLKGYGGRLAIPRRMKQQIDCDGYASVQLRWTNPRWKNLKRRYRKQRAFVHRLVWMAAHDCIEIPRGLDVNHLDGDPLNNNHRNLVLQTERANRTRSPMTEAEIRAIEEFMLEEEYAAA